MKRRIYALFLSLTMLLVGCGRTNGIPIVYMTTDISPEGLMSVYEALGASPSGNIAVKLSTGEPGRNYCQCYCIIENL